MNFSAIATSRKSERLRIAINTLTSLLLSVCCDDHKLVSCGVCIPPLKPGTPRPCTAEVIDLLVGAGVDGRGVAKDSAAAHSSKQIYNRG